MLLPINKDHPEPRKIRRAVDLLEKGAVIGYPTDTVYGLGCDLMNKGAIEQVGTPMELYHTPVNQFVAGFIGSPKMNFIAGELVSATTTLATVKLHEGTVVQVAADATSLPVGAKLTLGARPEHIEASKEPPAADNAVKGHVQLAEHRDREAARARVEDALAIGRAKQENKEGYGKRLRERFAPKR